MELNRNRTKFSMIRSFFKHYLELPDKVKNVVCLGGGVGTAQVLKGLREDNLNLTAIVSMADDGGSAGRVRRAFAVPPPGDIVNCLAALSSEESVLKDLFVYRFKGERYGKDTDLEGQKLGNLIFVALTDIFKGDYNRALEEFSKIISPSGRVLPATDGNVNIWAKTKQGTKVYGEKNIDLGKYNGDRTLTEVHLDPPDIKAYKASVDALIQADLIIVGPGDLFSTILPVLVVPQIKKTLLKIETRKVFIINVANKPFETKGYKVSDYLKTLKNHLDKDIFGTILVNNDQKVPIPKSLNYKYVDFDKENLQSYHDQIIEGDLLNESYPLYHDSQKIAEVVNSMLI